MEDVNGAVLADAQYWLLQQVRVVYRHYPGPNHPYAFTLRRPHTVQASKEF